MMKEQLYTYSYPHPSVTADMVVFGIDRNELKVLLIERRNDPFKSKWALPGGFVNMDESCEEGAIRELIEETGLTCKNIEPVRAFSEPHRDPRERVISVAFYTLMYIKEVKGGDDAAKAQWFGIDEIPPLAFDHDMILSEALKRLRIQVFSVTSDTNLFEQSIDIRQLECLLREAFS